MRYLKIIGFTVAMGMLLGVSPVLQAAGIPDPQQIAVGQTPPRLSFMHGQVSFWRPGDRDWTQAQLNTPLASGDRLYTGTPGNLELQVGSRAFVRAWADTEIGLEDQEPDFLKFAVTTGSAAFDLRKLEPGRTVEVDTPNARFIINDAGYYRVDVDGQQTSFITRRGGQAAVTFGSGNLLDIAPSTEVVIHGAARPQINFYTAPQLDEWDNWNYARTDRLMETLSARYVSPTIYGAGDLDAYGTWRIVSGYGPIWVPTAVPHGWAPYSSGTWIKDPFYGWTWVDAEPWGWAPYHYGRWVFVNGYWGWAPGPLPVKPLYAPALVAFFGGSSGSSVVGWVALGWGEPLIPWWGPKGFIHRPWWGGWGGPRVVNNKVIKKTTVVNVRNITVYRNAGVRKSLVAVDQNHFGRGSLVPARMIRADAKNFRPNHTAPRFAAPPAKLKPILPKLDVSPGGKEFFKAGPSAIRQAQPQSQRKPPVSGPAALKPKLQARRTEDAPRAKKHSKVDPVVNRQTPPRSGRKQQVIGSAKERPHMQVRRTERIQPQVRRLQNGPATQLSAKWVKAQKKPSTFSRPEPKVRRKGGFGRGDIDG